MDRRRDEGFGGGCGELRTYRVSWMGWRGTRQSLKRLPLPSQTMDTIEHRPPNSHDLTVRHDFEVSLTVSRPGANIIIVISHDEICITPGARLARLERHLEIRRHSNPPTAMGLSPPFFFRQARRVAPQRRGRIEGGVRPATIMRVRILRIHNNYIICTSR